MANNYLKIIEKIKNEDKTLTYSECLNVVKSNYKYINIIPKEFLNENLCLSALNLNKDMDNLIQHFPKELFTEKFIIKVAKIDIRNIEFLSDEYINKELIFKLIKVSASSIQYIPQKYKTNENYVDFATKEPKILSYIEPMTMDLCEAVFTKNWTSFKYIPDKYKTLEQCKKIIKKNINYIKYCHEKIINEEICITVCNKDGCLLEYIPEIFKTEEICLLAIGQNEQAFEYVPHNMINNYFILKCFSKKCGIVRFLDEEFRTKELYLEILNNVSFSDIFKENLKNTKKMCDFDSVFEREVKILRELINFANYIEDDILDKDIIKKEKELGVRVYESQYDSDTELFVVDVYHYGQKNTLEFNNFDEYYAYLDGDLKGANLVEYEFKEYDNQTIFNVEKGNIVKYNLEGSYLNSNILIKLDKYDNSFYEKTISRYDNNVSSLISLKNETIDSQLILHENIKTYFKDRRIYYITDIHMDHRLIEDFPYHASYDEIRLYIQKYIKKMISTIDRTDKWESCNDLLLIGGDVSFCFDISEMFYKELINFWKPENIIVVLGNHELWDDNYFVNNQMKNLNEIIEKYKTMFSKLKINFLQNSLFISNKKFGISSKNEILSADEILNMNEIELHKKTVRSNLIIFGGIGFSGYNNEFNATYGLYKQTIPTIEQDLKYTMETEKIYNKICDVFANKEVIIFTHMPVTDWSKKERLSNWIYVSGHTHYNELIYNENCKVFSDNQMGYKTKNGKLKYFSTDLNCDIFKYYPDGIYEINKKAYEEFNIGKGIKCQFNKKDEYIIMLKKSDLYMFLLERDTGLYILDGGKTSKLSYYELEYYFERMELFSNFIKLRMNKFNKVLKKISEEVKRIGGSGKIHGSIIDIDFVNHINVDPENFKITVYYSPRYGIKIEYQDIESLLNDKTPHLYEKYKKIIKNNIENSFNLINFNVNVEKNINYSENDDVMLDYKYSKLIKSFQYLTECNVIRTWNDDLMEQIESYMINDSNKYIK